MSNPPKAKLQPIVCFDHWLDQHCSQALSSELPYSAGFMPDYPDVPDPHQTTWTISDQETRHSNDWQAHLSKTKSALLVAAEECDVLATATQQTTPASLTMSINRFKSSLYKAEDTIAALHDLYPLPAVRTPSDLAAQPDPAIPTPMLLYHSDDQILFWLPALPNKSRSTNSHLYTDFRALLQAHQFPLWGPWHCDFIHVFSASNEGAILGARDVDNYPYKPFIDALVLALKSSDGAFNFSCAMYNFLSDRIKSGCYISITKKSKKVRFFDDFESLVLAKK